MSIDPNLTIPGPQIRNPLDFAVEGAQLQNLSATAAQRTVELANAARAFQDDTIVRQAAKDSQVPDPGNPGQTMTDHKAMLAKLSASENPTLAPKYDQIFQTQSLDAQLKNLEYQHNTLSGIYDDQSYQRAANDMSSRGTMDIRKIMGPDYKAAVKRGILAKAREKTLTDRQSLEFDALKARNFSEIGNTQTGAVAQGLPPGGRFGQLPPGIGGIGQSGPPPAQPRAPQPQGPALPARPPTSGQGAQNAPAGPLPGQKAKLLPNGRKPDEMVKTPQGFLPAAQAYKTDPATLLKANLTTGGVRQGDKIEIADAINKRQQNVTTAVKALTAFNDSYDPSKHIGIGGIPTQTNVDMQHFDELLGPTVKGSTGSVSLGAFGAVQDNLKPNPYKDYFTTNARETRKEALIDYLKRNANSDVAKLKAYGIDPKDYESTNIDAALATVPAYPYRVQKGLAEGFKEGTKAFDEKTKTPIVFKGGKWQPQ